MMRIVIPGNPKSQKRHRTAKSGHRYDPSSADKKELRKSMLHAKPVQPLSGKLKLEITAFMQTPQSWSKKKQKEVEGKFRPKTPDCDNIEKIICDAMNNYIIEDDRYIVSSTVEKRYSMQPCTVIELSGVIE